MIIVENLSKTIENPPSKVEILRGISFEVPAGQFLAVMGASGSGKSTLLGLMAGLDTATSGRIVLDGTDITHLAEDAMARVRGRKSVSFFKTINWWPRLPRKKTYCCRLN